VHILELIDGNELSLSFYDFGNRQQHTRLRIRKTGFINPITPARREMSELVLYTRVTFERKRHLSLPFEGPSSSIIRRATECNSAVESQNEIPIRWGSTPRCVLEYQSNICLSFSWLLSLLPKRNREIRNKKKRDRNRAAWTLGGNLFTAPEPKLATC